MKVFISWSGERSLRVATKLKEWLPLIFQSIEPWISSEDIRKGSRWQQEMTQALEKPTAGILVLTQDNLPSPWLHFEAGAISKAVAGTESFVCTYLIDVEAAGVAPPLGMFQATKANREDTFRLLATLNNAAGDKAIAKELVEKLFSTFWPELEKVIEDVRKTPNVQKPSTRSDRQILEEILESVRAMVRDGADEVAARNLSHAREMLAGSFWRDAMSGQPVHFTPSMAQWLSPRNPSKPSSEVEKVYLSMICPACHQRITCTDPKDACPKCGSSLGLEDPE